MSLVYQSSYPDIAGDALTVGLELIPIMAALALMCALSQVPPFPPSCATSPLPPPPQVHQSSTLLSLQLLRYRSNIRGAEFKLYTRKFGKSPS
jgi:hypothetical protein